MSNLKCIIILSYKSSGSTALQGILSSNIGINTSKYTRHVYNETLFWSKAASVLKMSQGEMYKSQTPMSYDAALISLNDYLSNNLNIETNSSYTKKNIFEYWKQLCEINSPVFLEKSPHHLYQESVLELITECIEYFSNEIDFQLIGLVRNPMAMLYSDYTLRKSNPSINQYIWLKSYENLLRFKKIHDRLIIIKYEDMVNNVNSLNKVIKFTGLKYLKLSHDYLHTKSIDKWLIDREYDFNLDLDVIATAEKFGYTIESLTRNRWL